MIHLPRITSYNVCYTKLLRENIAIGGMFGAQGHRMNVDECMEMADRYIDLIGLKGYSNKPAGGLTPTEKKLVEIARALAMKPKLLLMDEAMAGMNPKDIDHMVELIKQIRDAENIAIVSMVEHIMRAVAGLAERVMVMHQGAKLVDEPTREALSNPRVIEVYVITSYSIHYTKLYESTPPSSPCTPGLPTPIRGRR